MPVPKVSLLAKMGKGVAQAATDMAADLGKDKWAKWIIGAGIGAGMLKGAKDTVTDYAKDSGMTPDIMSDYAVRSAFSGSKGSSDLQNSTEGLTLALSGGKSTYNKSIRKRF